MIGNSLHCSMPASFNLQKWYTQYAVSEQIARMEIHFQSAYTLDGNDNR